jgi:hypothetical protein
MSTISERRDTVMRKVRQVLNGDVKSISRHCRAIVTAFANAEDADNPVEDPTFRQLVDEVAAFPQPAHGLQFLGAMVVSAHRIVSRIERDAGHDDFSLAATRDQLLMDTPPGGMRVTIHKCFDVIEDLAAPVRDEGSLARSLSILTGGYGARATVALAWIYLRIALTAQEVDPSLTLEILLADWALSEEASLQDRDDG